MTENRSPEQGRPAGWLEREPELRRRRMAAAQAFARAEQARQLRDLKRRSQASSRARSAARAALAPHLPR